MLFRSRPCGPAVDLGAFEFCAELPARFQRGDLEADGDLNTTDAVLILTYLYLGGAAPGCPRAADIDDSGVIEITDAVNLLRHLYLGEAPPPPPFSECGLDETADALTCERFAFCDS